MLLLLYMGFVLREAFNKAYTLKPLKALNVGID